MTFYRSLVIACLAVCLRTVNGRSASNMEFGPLYSHFASDHPDCLRDQLMICMAPAMAFAMSPEGQQLQAFDITRTNISQIITDYVFNSICSIAPNVAHCGFEWTNRCVPPEIQDFNRLLSRATGKILSFCNETDGYLQFTKIANCAIKTRTPAQTCEDNVGRTAEIQLRADITGHTDTGPAEPKPTETAIGRMNLQKLACCNGNKIKECLAPVLGNGCTPEEKTLTETFIDRILGALECTDALYRC